MGAYWLFDLPDVIEASGLEVDTWPGWESRSRGSGGYDAVWAVFVHHTASKTSMHNDCSYMWDSTSGDQPIGAIYLDRSGLVMIGAAGATNCQGAGGPYPTSHGTIPLDKGNAYGIAIEAGNNGTGEPWPRAQQDAYTILCATLCAAYDLDPLADVISHREWAPTRKVDPAGPSDWAIGSAPWDMNRFRDDCEADVSPTPPTPTPPQPPALEDDVLFICKVGTVIYVGDGVRASAIAGADVDTLTANVEGNGTARWHHPARSGLPILTRMGDIPTINAGQRDCLVGKLL